MDGSEIPGVPRLRPARLIGCRSGATAVEFALVAFLFLGTLMALFQIFFVLFQQHMLDDATSRAVRAIQIGQPQQAAVKTADEFKARYFCPHLIGAAIDCDKVIVDIRTNADNSSVFDAGIWNGPVDAAASPYCVGSSGEYMSIRFVYPAPVLVPSLIAPSAFQSFGGRTVLMLEARGALRTEPTAGKRVGAC